MINIDFKLVPKFQAAEKYILCWAVLDHVVCPPLVL
jgi:hypothetical protein